MAPYKRTQPSRMHPTDKPFKHDITCKAPLKVQGRREQQANEFRLVTTSHAAAGPSWWPHSI